MTETTPAKVLLNNEILLECSPCIASPLEREGVILINDKRAGKPGHDRYFLPAKKR
ncbi:hypothetical protein [uncultured Methanoregula sp.]|uniref:hypothetical protein n=1 Tax=uncultured Methanoregula sp. TaxID=1005933 RepID=UPI002AAA714F|nr:hypothetical protein [uncultured Methanoregula sp.]